MAKKRVYEIAKQLNISNRELIDMLKEIGIDVNNHIYRTDKRYGKRRQEWKYRKRSGKRSF